MNQYVNEIDASFLEFDRTCIEQIDGNFAQLAKHASIFTKSYKKIVSMQAWRECLFSQILSPACVGFFLEAQNDVLVSHANARIGAWRVALQSLRACIENALCALYFADHPIELRRWENLKFRIGFSELVKYFDSHPDLHNIGPGLKGIPVLQGEYSTLSAAVHGSAPQFRMTQDDATRLWIAEPKLLKAWATRQGLVILGINLLCLVLYRDHLLGAKNRELRQAVSFAIPEKKQRAIKDGLKITLFKY